MRGNESTRIRKRTFAKCRDLVTVSARVLGARWARAHCDADFHSAKRIIGKVGCENTDTKLTLILPDYENECHVVSKYLVRHMKQNERRMADSADERIAERGKVLQLATKQLQDPELDSDPDKTEDESDSGNNMVESNNAIHRNEAVTNVNWVHTDGSMPLHSFLHHKASLVHYIGANVTSAGHGCARDLFEHFLPAQYLRQVMIKVTNEQARKSLSTWTPLTWDEFMKWLGLAWAMTTIVLPSRRMFWIVPPTNENQTLMSYPNFGRFMKRQRWEDILHELRFVKKPGERIVSVDKLWHTRGLFEAFSIHFACAWKPGSHLCEDETIGPWTGRGTEHRPAMPAHQKMRSKPHNGRMIKDICCGESGVIVNIDIVEASTNKRRE